MGTDGWVPSRDVRNYADGQLTVTITLAEYRYLVARVDVIDAIGDLPEGGGDGREG